MQKIVPCLWFDTSAEEAMNFYTSLLPDSKIISIERYPENPPADFMQELIGRVLTGIFELGGFRFMALDGGPQFTFNPSVSFFINCKSRDEVDRLWESLSEDGETLMPLDEYPFSDRYGWIQDRYGVSWQLMLVADNFEQKIVPSLLFVGDVCGRAEEAINFYTSLFDRSSIADVSRYGPGSESEEEGNVMYAGFTLDGQLFAAMDSGLEHNFSFNEAISFYVECADQAEVDRFWEALSEVPEAEQCGWLKDKFGISWQIVPRQLGELLSDPDREKAERVMGAMLQMKKIDVAGLQEAYAG